MVLNSQSPRTDSPGKSKYHAAYSRSRRRRGGKSGWLLAALLLVGAYAVYHFAWNPGPGDATEDTGSPDEPSLAVNDEPAIPTPAPHPPARPATPPDRPVGRGAADAGKPEKPQPPERAEEPVKPPTPPPTAALSAGDPQVAQALNAADQLVAAGKLVQARDQLNRLHTRRLSGADAAKVRAAMTKVNQTLVFGPTVVAGDPLATVHVIQEGDLLSTLAPAHHISWQFVQRVNGVDPDRIRIGQKIKLIRGPFHVAVDKSDYRLDVYLGDPTKPGSTYVRSFDVGVGASDSTPVGRFIVKRGGKAENPPWINPRNRTERYSADDPKNPIGDRWVGLRGLDAKTEALEGYGIHGTIEPQSIGKQASMGCVRMRDDDVKLVYDLLTEEKSTVTITE